MKFSIIIPVYNVASWLRECLDSVLAAAKDVSRSLESKSKSGGENSSSLESKSRVEFEERKVEVICVDDGSTDGSGAILDEYGALGDRALPAGTRILVIHQANAGVSAARNAALDVATGDWILFVDADDVIAPCTLSHLEEAAIANPQADVIAFKTRRFNDGEKTTLAGDSTPLTLEQTIDSHMQLDAKNAMSNFAEKAYRRSNVTGLRFRPYIVGEDKLYMLQAFLRSRCTVVTNSILYGYRMRRNSAMHTHVTVRKVQDRINYSLDELLAIEASPKAVSPEMVRNIANWETEQVAVGLSQLQASERRDVINEWCNALKQFSSLSRISSFQRIRARLFLIFPLWSVARILFLLPGRVKVTIGKLRSR